MLFKILHGDSSRISTDITPYHEGYCYVTHDGYFYVDMNNERVKLNAKDAETLTGASLSTILNSSDIEIPTSKAVLTAIESIKVDWNQNDPDGVGHILNRTHYVKEPIEREFYSYTNNAPSFKQHSKTKKYYASISEVPYFTIDNTYLLTINGKEYEIVAREDDFLGNRSLYGSYENTGEDFLIRNGYIYFDGDTPPSAINILIHEIYAEVVQLDEKFISYKPGKIVAGQEFVVEIDGEEHVLTAGRGAEVFNDYKYNRAIGAYSHAEGGESIAIGHGSHAEGYGSVAADGEGAHAEGVGYAFGYATHAEGGGTASCGYYSHAEGYETEALYYADHAEGCGTVAAGSSSHAEGEETLASEWTSHSEGYRSVAAGRGAHAEGYHDDNVIEVRISGEANSNTFQLDNAYDIEVGNLIVYRKKFNYELSYEPYDRHSFITSYDPATLTITTSRNLSGDDAIDGEEAYIYKGGVAAGDGSHIEGEGTFAMGTNQHVQGRYNLVDSEGKYAHIVGNGTSTNRSNAHTIDWNGNAWFAGNIYSSNSTPMVKLQNTNSGNSGYMLMGTSSLVDVGVQFSGTEDTRLRVGRYNNGTPCLTIYHKADGVGKYYNVYNEYSNPNIATTASVTTAEYNTMAANNQLKESTLYMLTDDTSEEDLQTTVDTMNNIDYDTYLKFDTNEIV